ncbi:MAG: acetate/propionate family kinase [Prochloraceae cyanobacterium]
MKILVLNAGSSSQKSCLYQITGDNLPAKPTLPLWKASIDWNSRQLKIKTDSVEKEIKLDSDDLLNGISAMLDTLITKDTKVLNTLQEIDLVGHRVVHGGTKYSQPTKITKAVTEAIADLIPLAPAHNPANLEGIKAIEKVLGENIPQVAVFDTAFHSQIPQKTAAYPIPYQWFEKGIRRYGFHGISHQYCARRGAQLLNKDLKELKIITCHLGNGCSLAAIENGKSINTTMGFTPLEGLMMGTRSGSIDPAILIYLLREHNFNADDLDKMLNKASGLQGVSGLSNDMRQIIAAIDKDNLRAKLALDMFLARLQSSIGSMLASLGGLDVLVFTAGIGENNALIRQRACDRFEFIGLKLDRDRNNCVSEDAEISTPDSTVKVLVINTAEDWAIASECWQLEKTSN